MKAIGPSLKRSCPVKAPDGMEYRLELSLKSDSSGAFWNISAWDGELPVLDFGCSPNREDKMRSWLSWLKISISMMRDEILEELRKNFDRETSLFLNDIFRKDNG